MVPGAWSDRVVWKGLEKLVVKQRLRKEKEMGRAFQRGLKALVCSRSSKQASLDEALLRGLDWVEWL